MKCSWLIACVAGLLAVGCSAPEQATAPAPKPPIAATQPAPAPTTPEPSEPDPAQKDPRYNARRIHQLSELRVVPITVGGHKFKAWLMVSGCKRQEGMMFLLDKDVKADEAMLFVFPEKQPLSFWMHNTWMPLDIAYFTEGFKLLNVQQGKVKDDKPLPATGDSQYVVEFKLGTCKRLGIKPGAKLTIPSDIRGEA